MTQYLPNPGLIRLFFLIAMLLLAGSFTPGALAGDNHVPEPIQVAPFSLLESGSLIHPVFRPNVISEEDGFIIVPGTVELEDELQNAFRSALSDAGGLLPASKYYAATDIRAADGWRFVSVAGLELLDAQLGWRLADANWVGLVVLNQQEDGHWIGATEGTPEFSSLLAKVPDNILTPAAKLSLDPRQRSMMIAETYRFPWQSGKTMLYGSLGVHNNGFSSVVPDWKAVDFLSDGDTGAGHAPNQLLAAASGSISYVCNDGTSAAVRIGDLFYTHLLYNGNLYTGRSFSQSDVLGSLKSGSFNDNCGWASQGSNWFHVHWGFPNNGYFSVEDWTLNLSDGLWRRSGETQGIGHWFEAEGSSCSAPSLIEPDSNATLSNRTITFRWNAVSGCRFNDYTFRVCTSSDVSSPDNCFIDQIEGETQRTETITGHDYQDLWWGVKAANAPNGASWASRQFRIESYVRIHSGYTENAPTIDGQILAGEWIDANVYDITLASQTSMGSADWSGPPEVNLPDDRVRAEGEPDSVRLSGEAVTLYAMSDATHLYLSFDNPNDTSDDSGDEIGVYFDDDPLPSDGQWTNTACGHADGEGNYWVKDGPEATYREWIAGPDACDSVEPAPGVSGAVGHLSGHAQAEIMIELDTSALQASPGSTIYMCMWIYDETTDTMDGKWPANADFQDPSTYGAFMLAVGGIDLYLPVAVK